MRRTSIVAELGGALLACAAALLALATPPGFGSPILLINESPSVPRGLYVRSGNPIAPGVFVTVRAAQVANAYVSTRRPGDMRAHFIKRVAAMHPNRLCAEGAHILLNGARIADRLSVDAAGHALPSWRGCRALRVGEILLLGDTRDSFDGRYWGPVSAALVEGVWRPLLTE